MDIFEKLRNNSGPIGTPAKMLNSHHYFSFPMLEGELGPRMRFMGREVLNWSLNNYLGLANHPEVRKADAEAAAKWGLAYPMGARMMSGNSVLHETFEKELAQFVGKTDAFLLNYGYQGVMSAIECLCDHRDVIVYDAESHACLIDGIRLHKAKLGEYYKFNHNDMVSLEKNLIRATKLAEEKGGGVLVITEGVFGMSGKVGDLKAIAELKKKYNFRLLVDDAHGFGTMGETGAGVGELLGVQDEIDLYFSTFAKSMAAIGAFIASNDPEIIMFLKYNMRSQTYAKALPMPYVEGCRKRLEMIKQMPELRAKLWENVKAMQDGLRSRGFNIGETESPVTPVFLHSEGGVPEVTRMVRDLRENMGVFCSIVVYPVVPKGQIMLRIIPTASHTLEDVEYTLNAFTTLAEKLKNRVYQSDAVQEVVE
ncbi:glycine C-acetyltransferase [Dyadobacter sp. BE34]|uniref:Glycine C-acetyltransferase n=1 Tax=Dyadobacter fermentans TaxID=94254 RepID=A0ABU1R4V7_9BACT|nr:MULTISPECIES: aminotransferase class I/II-fold pyridoxal phosphate-dependent enzyme [Dyadobacter]MDR6808451.1 glycine C-acetyltransferase [Dyadobacter fermentans]MDR7045732.1 glycine C-acetyltransferase [Dyadobacter sp. BE242]MDR7200045.1 glycine C-acetyltransferase [Dyadobacter sp. BE34]MDR7218005.1 glycine C-acetyltransferase [Dyadobacter sp. BE31]MDR7265936.1 glycine C-acetyltransferase [Dyadobacter sp. BE32]